MDTTRLTLRRVKDPRDPASRGLASAKWLNSMIFHHDDDFEGPEKGNEYWVAKIVGTEFPVAFCSIRPLTNEPNVLFLSRAGVLRGWRGQGLQKRMIRARLAWARRNGWREAVTYTTHDNYASIASLIKAGMNLYTPENPWGTDHALHFRTDLRI